MTFKKDISFVMLKWFMKLWRSLSADHSLPNFVQSEDFDVFFRRPLEWFTIWPQWLDFFSKRSSHERNVFLRFMDSKELKQRFCRPKTLASSGLTRYGCCNPPQWSQNLNDKKHKTLTWCSTWMWTKFCNNPFKTIVLYEK